MLADEILELGLVNAPPTVDTSMQIICLPWGVWQGGMCTMDTAYFYLNSNLGSYMGGGIYTTSIGRNSAHAIRHWKQREWCIRWL